MPRTETHANSRGRGAPSPTPIRLAGRLCPTLLGATLLLGGCGNADDAEQVGADAVGYGDSVHVLFIEEDTGRLFHTRRNGEGDWSEPTLEVDGEEVLWVRGTVIKESDQGAV